jgi:signal transduction histidine kinase/phage shock protein PspC (stress-responsive transcriptional regulator)
MSPRRFRITTMQRGSDRVIAGVASGVAEALRVDPLIVRVGFVVLSVAGGIGIPLYFGLWWLMPGPDGERHMHVRAHGRQLGGIDLQHGDLRQPLAIGLIVAGIVLLFRNVGPWFSDAAVWPLTLGGFGAAVLWARSDDTERARLTQAAGRPFQAVVGGRQGAVRLGVGAVLVFSGIGVFLAANDALGAARQVGLAIVVTIAGLAVILGPWIRRLLADLSEERRERIRSEERAEVAAHLHDSVLQTLALIQRNADRPKQLAALARRQERELRTWLYGDRLASANGHGGTLAAAVDAMVAEVEELHGIEVEVVTVGECPVDARVEGLLQAAREATVNAAKHAGVETVSLYVEAEPDSVTAFVRDRGRGFDTTTVPDDRRGIAESIRQRMARNGGTAVITSVPGEGTEVTLELKRP